MYAYVRPCHVLVLCSCTVCWLLLVTVGGAYLLMCVCCVVIPYCRLSFKLMPVLDLKWKHLSSRIFSKLMTSQSVGCLTHFSIQEPKCPQEDQ